MANLITTKTLQTLFDYALIQESIPKITEVGTDDYAAKGRDILTLIVAVNKLANESAPIFGTGSPESLVTSTISQLYIDTATNDWYSNPNLGVNTGWVVK